MSLSCLSSLSLLSNHLKMIINFIILLFYYLWVIVPRARMTDNKRVFMFQNTCSCNREWMSTMEHYKGLCSRSMIEWIVLRHSLIYIKRFISNCVSMMRKHDKLNSSNYYKKDKAFKTHLITLIYLSCMLTK